MRRVVITRGWCAGQHGNVTGELVKPIDGCTLWVHLDTYPNPMGFKAEDVQDINHEGVSKMTTTPQAITIDQVVEAYVKTRDELTLLKKEYDTKEIAIKELQDRRANWILQQLDTLGAQNVKTTHGTVYQMRKEQVTMGDWDSFFSYVLETQQFNLLQHAVSKTAALEIMGENREHTPPPGVNYVAIRTVGIRRS